MNYSESAIKPNPPPPHYQVLNLTIDYLITREILFLLVILAFIKKIIFCLIYFIDLKQNFCCNIHKWFKIQILQNSRPYSFLRVTFELESSCPYFFQFFFFLALIFSNFQIKKFHFRSTANKTHGFSGQQKAKAELRRRSADGPSVAREPTREHCAHGDRSAASTENTSGAGRSCSSTADQLWV